MMSLVIYVLRKFLPRHQHYYPCMCQRQLSKCMADVKQTRDASVLLKGIEDALDHGLIVTWTYLTTHSPTYSHPHTPLFQLAHPQG